VGDLPGPNASTFANLNLGAMPNPAVAARNVTLRFTIAKPQNVTVRIYNVAGREVANLSKSVAEAGPVHVVWDGRLSTGARAAAGVYFYRVDGIEFEAGSAPTKMILLSATQ
jgi:flagellar hook assembly protein FlgD